MKVDIAVKGILFNKEHNRILLVQRGKKDSVGANDWESAGGGIEWGEHPEEAMKREIKEETGITDVSIDRVAYVSIVYGEPSFMIVAYICETSEETVVLSSEHQAYVWADKEECRKLLSQVILDDFEKNGIFDLFEAV